MANRPLHLRWIYVKNHPMVFIALVVVGGFGVVLAATLLTDPARGLALGALPALFGMSVWALTNNAGYADRLPKTFAHERPQAAPSPAPTEGDPFAPATAEPTPPAPTEGDRQPASKAKPPAKQKSKKQAKPPAKQKPKKQATEPEPQTKPAPPSTTKRLPQPQPKKKPVPVVADKPHPVPATTESVSPPGQQTPAPAPATEPTAAQPSTRRRRLKRDRATPPPVEEGPDNGWDPFADYRQDEPDQEKSAPADSPEPAKKPEAKKPETAKKPEAKKPETAKPLTPAEAAKRAAELSKQKRRSRRRS